jgi:hypothetical protein
MQISMLKCQTRLMAVWVIGCGITGLVAFLQIIFGHYGENGSEAVGLLLPSITPTLALVVGVWGNNALKKNKTTEKVGKSIYGWVFGASIFYLALVALSLALQPMVARPPIDVLKDARLILVPFQAVVSAFIGIFFTQNPK